MSACAFVRAELLFAISLKLLSITSFGRTDFNFDGYGRRSSVWSISIGSKEKSVLFNLFD